jgi:hypothetical protein
MKIPRSELELIDSELLWCVERLLKAGLTIPEARQAMRERLSVL